MAANSKRNVALHIIDYIDWIFQNLNLRVNVYYVVILLCVGNQIWMPFIVFVQVLNSIAFPLFYLNDAPPISEYFVFLLIVHEHIVVYVLVLKLDILVFLSVCVVGAISVYSNLVS